MELHLAFLRMLFVAFEDFPLRMWISLIYFCSWDYQQKTYFSRTIYMYIVKATMRLKYICQIVFEGINKHYSHFGETDVLLVLIKLNLPFHSVKNIIVVA